MTALAVAPTEQLVIVEASLGEGLPIAERTVPAAEAPALVDGWARRWRSCTVTTRPARAGVEWT